MSDANHECYRCNVFRHEIEQRVLRRMKREMKARVEQEVMARVHEATAALAARLERVEMQLQELVQRGCFSPQSGAVGS